MPAALNAQQDGWILNGRQCFIVYKLEKNNSEGDSKNIVLQCYYCYSFIEIPILIELESLLKYNRYLV